MNKSTDLICSFFVVIAIVSVIVGYIALGIWIVSK